MQKVDNLNERIYAFCFAKPRYEREIISHIYQVEKPYSSSHTTKMSSKVKLLLSEHWLIEWKPPKHKVSDKIMDQREKKRKYVLSSADPLLDYIVSKGVQLTVQDRKQLKDVIEDNAVRHLILEDLRIKSIEEMSRRMSILALLSYFSMRYMYRCYPYTKQLSKREFRKIIRSKKKVIHKIEENIEEKFHYVAPNLIVLENINLSANEQNEIIYGSYEFISLGESLILKLAKLTPDYDIIATLVIFAYSTAETFRKHH